ncbi:MAG: hypothetical protein AAB817_00955 [Patescibacteria group bacterium]
MLWQKLFMSLVIAIGLVIAPAVWAAEPVIHAIATDYWYPQTFDNLLLDVTLYPNSADAAAAVKTMTVGARGTARAGAEVAAVRLWQDGGLAGWQGYGQDTVVTATITLDTTANQWIITPTALTIPVAGQRLFITADTATHLASQKTVQGYISARYDSNGDGSYQAGDAGIFWANTLATTNSELANPALQVIKETRIDLLGPDAWLTSVSDGGTITGAAATLTGQARDQGITQNVALVEVGIGAATDTIQWYPTTTADAYANWQYAWANIAPGKYYLNLRATDTSGNVKTGSAPIAVTVAVAAPVTPVTPAPPVEAPATLAAGTLVKTAASSQVWVISDGQKRWVTSGEVFTGLGYQWSEIKTISQVTLDAYLVGEPLTVTYRHPNGTLIKYQTYPEVYLLDKGSRRHIANETAFLGLGYHWSAMVTVPDWEQYPDGTEIQLP